MLTEVAKYGPAYKPPAYNTLRTRLLDQACNNVKDDLLKLRDGINQRGATLVSDGWDDASDNPLVNFLLVTDEGAEFLGSVDTTGQIKDMQYLADRLAEAIEEVGAENVIQVVTDNASNCVGAGTIVEEK